jgi:hypothetical protein
MENFLDEDRLRSLYSIINNAQKNGTQLDNTKVDLFIVLDISGSMA